MFVQGIERVRFSAQALGQSSRAPCYFRDRDRNIRQVPGVGGAYADLLPHSLGERGYKLVPVERRLLRNQLLPAGGIVKRHQPLDHGIAFLSPDFSYAPLEPHVLQLLFKFSQNPAANESDRSGGHAEFFRNLLIRTRRSLEK